MKKFRLRHSHARKQTATFQAKRNRSISKTISLEKNVLLKKLFSIRNEIVKKHLDNGIQNKNQF